MRKFFLTVGYSGLFPFAPGTIGTLVSTPIALLILIYLPQSTLMMLSILITIIAIKQIDIYEKQTNTHDASIIVIDELVGVWIALAFSSETMFQVVLSVVLFRVFDIWKPSIIGKIDREYKGGFGVMMDDVVAGIAAGFASSIIYGVYIKYW